MKNILIVILMGASLSFSQGKDSTIIFTSPEPETTKPEPTVYDDAWGVDILLSNNGFGFGGFYRHEYSRNIFGTVTFGIAESKDDNEVEYYDYWGQSYAPGKINRFLLIPVLFGVQYRLFADDITDSFRPYVNAGAGPTMVLVHPYRDEGTGEQMDYFRSLGLARPRYTLGGYIGAGAFFGADMGSLSGINIRYYFVPVDGGIESLVNGAGKKMKKTDFGGFFITINLGSAF
ncbi:MAG: hypothetical protein WCX28_14295 [Bacteriovoracaceae bacterium]|nr:hypothetical protein [Bacteroidota bacterium]